MACLPLAAQSYMESYNVVSSEVIEKKEDIRIIRNINGGTVILPEFDETCPEDLKAPFCFACKIVEEYLPPSLPIRVKVSVDDLTGQYANSISRVRSYIIENFAGDNNASIPMTRIKGVILAEMANSSRVTFEPYVPDKDFLTEKYDITITYNYKYLDEMSFSLEASPGNCYDFISLVLRDLLKGFGLVSDYKYNIITKGLDKPSRPLTYFEEQIDKALGQDLSPVEKLANATKGVLRMLEGYKTTLNLYAPFTWKNGISLNYFSPQEGCDLTNILAPDFCKGMVYRSLSDNYSEDIFNLLLGWAPDVACGTEFDCKMSGSTSVLMPYNGSANLQLNSSNQDIQIDNYDFYTTTTPKATQRPIEKTSIYGPEDKYELSQYLELFHPFFTGDLESPNTSVSISILKKDGSWDVVELCSYNKYTFKMSDWTFHCDESEYARTIDGYLRGRLTTKCTDTYHTITYYPSLFFVIDYLPQKVSMKCKLMNDTTATTAAAHNPSTSLTKTVKIYFYNTEGVEQIILERLKQGSRIPNKIPITDFKKGYYETSIDKTTTFTAVAYNKNGSSRGLPVTIVPTNTNTFTNNITIDYNKQCIKVKSEAEPALYSYDIRHILSETGSSSISGYTEELIDISGLSDGEYVLSVTETTTNTSKTIKFRK